MSDDLVTRLRGWCRDYSGEMMVRNALPLDGLTCGLLYDAADEIERLRSQLAKANADLAALNLCEPGFLDRVLRERDSLREQQKPVKALVDAMDQALDDMGLHGQSVCMATKAMARVAFEPFLQANKEDFGDEYLMPLEEAQRILKECDR